MKRTKRVSQGSFLAQLQEGGELRQVDRNGRRLYAAVDVVAMLTNSDDAPEVWELMKQDEPVLAAMSEAAMFPSSQHSLPGMEQMAHEDAVDLEGVFRIVQSVPSAKAERMRRWLATTARERLEESANPELAVLRTRRLYESRGYSRRWVDKRLRGVSARHELTAEWYKRGAHDSEQYRALTNDLMRGAFGMEVEAYRHYKNLFKTGENLRDHMSDLELALTALGETVAVELHRQRDSHQFDALQRDASDAGDIVAKVRGEIESRTGRPVVQPANHRGWWAGRRRAAVRGPGAAEGGAVDVQPAPGHPGSDDVTPGDDTPTVTAETADKAVA